MTGFAVSWGIFILVVLLGASSGLQHGITQNFESTLSNAVELHAGWTQKPYKGLPTQRSLEFSDTEYRLLEQSDYVEMFSPAPRSTVSVTYLTQNSSMSVRGINQNFLTIKKITPIHGRVLNTSDFAQELKVTVINERALNELANGNTDIIGRYINLNGIFFRVIGVVASNQWEGPTAYIPLNIHQRIYSPDHKSSSIILAITPKAEAAAGDSLTKFDTYIRDLFSPTMLFDPSDRDAMWVDIREERMQDLSRVVDGLRLFIILVSICTLISGAVGVSNIMLVSVKERTKELGIRKALGAPPAAVMRSVVSEALIITLMFGVLGVLFGTGVVKVIDTMAGANADGESIFINPTVDMTTVGIALTILIIVGVIAGAIPARKAMNIKPIEAMNAD